MNTATNVEKISVFPEILFFLYILCNDNEVAYTTMLHMIRDLLTNGAAPAVPWDANVISLEILMRERGWRTGIGFGVGMTRREERRMSRLSQASLFGFSPSRDLPTFFATRSKLIAFQRITAFISSLSGYFILLPRGRSPRVGGAPTRVYPLSSRNNKLTLLNLSWAAFKSSSLRQQRAPAYLPTNIVTAFNSVIYLMLHAF